MGIHSLVTGLNGAGKTLYCVSDKLLPTSKATFEYRGVKVPRRLVVGGIRELLIPHELMEVPEIDPESWVDSSAKLVREPGQPVDPEVVMSITNWWLWCLPGDLIVVDECQRVFRPMAAGRRVPMFISKLETARHYGVEFLYLTQHPQLLHSNVRKLVGPHEDVRRVFGGKRTVIYQWDRVANPDQISRATSRIWKHDKSAFKLYKSAEVHGKFGQRLPMAVWMLIGGVVALGALAWVLKSRLGDRFSLPASMSAASAPASGVVAQKVPGSPGVVLPGRAGGGWPLYQSSAVVVSREPLADRALQIEGSYSVGPVAVAYFGLLIDGVRVSTITASQLVRMGYTYTDLGLCSGVLRFGSLERAITCAAAALPASPAGGRAGPSGGSAAPSPVVAAPAVATL